MKKKILIGVGVFVGLIVVFLIVVAMQSSEFHVRRSATINAPPEIVFEQVNDFSKWNAWSPWADLDPNAENTFKGPASGEGAEFHWNGNDDVGEGSMTILKSVPHDRIVIDLKFVRPFEDRSEVTFAFQPNEQRTVVSWSMDGKQNFMAKLMCLFMDMEGMVGTDFEKGLTQLNDASQAAAKEAAEVGPEPEPSDTATTEESS